MLPRRTMGSSRVVTGTGRGTGESLGAGSMPQVSETLQRLREEMPLLQLPERAGEFSTKPPGGKPSTGDGVKGGMGGMDVCTQILKIKVHRNAMEVKFKRII